MRIAGHLFRGVLPDGCVRVCVCDPEISGMRGPRPDLGCCVTKNLYINKLLYLSAPSVAVFFINLLKTKRNLLYTG